jgi:hypothetical protein
MDPVRPFNLSQRLLERFSSRLKRQQPEHSGAPSGSLSGGSTVKAGADLTSPSWGLGLGLLLLSAAGLTFQINLTRLFSVSQFYHFAFMIVSIALLGYGSSGTILAIFPGLRKAQPQRSLSVLSLAAGLSILGAYLLVNRLPFDSFSIAWETRQIYILVLHYAALALPFFFSGMAVGLLLAAYPYHSGQVYAVNLLGSALGCLLALLAPPGLGGEGTVVLSIAMAVLAGLISTPGAGPALPAADINTSGGRDPAKFLPRTRQALLPLVSLVILLIAVSDMGLRLSGGQGIRGLELHLSPYKSLSYALQVPGSEQVFTRWNSFSRIDLVRSPGIHTYPGLSYRYMEPLPTQDGLTVDGDDLTPIMKPDENLEFTGYLPAAVAFQLRPQAQALLLEPRGGLDILTALAQGAWQVSAVEMNPLIVSAAAEIYRDPRIRLEIDSDRSYLRRTAERFDVIVLSLTSTYHPVRSGAYSLVEDYRYTVEAFQDYLARLNPDGILVVTRWLQTPPSESLRTFALAVTALERAGSDPCSQIVALRGYNTAALLVKNSPYTIGELELIREFAADRAFDFTYAPGMTPEESNRYNILPEPVYYQAFTKLLDTQPRSAFYADYPFNVAPPTDGHPFFGHFFKWAQAGQVLMEVGRTWQPFGGAGYFVILALLLLALLMAGILIILPAAFSSRGQGSAKADPVFLVYFGLIGLAFMQVEIPLIQRFILFLGHPAYAMTAVLFTLLFFSALGSRLSSRLPLQPAIGLLVVLLLAAPWVLPWVFQRTLGLSLLQRFVITVILLGPAGFLMGVPFPGGIRRMLAGNAGSGQIPWIWAVNGAASVVSSVLAALLALSFGFDWVLRIGAVFYAGAWLAARLRAR